MKRNKIYIMMLLVGNLALSGCSSEQDTENMTGRTPITLGYTLQQAVVTRTTTTTINDAYIAAGGKVHVYITNHDDNTDVIYDNNFLVTNDTKDIGTTPASVMASVLAPMAGVPFYPEGGTVDISAYYPSSASSGSHTVMSDQTTDEGYAASDLMWATPVTNKGVSDDPVNLEFTHKMAKLIINVTKNTGINTISAIRLKNIAPTVTFDTSDGTTGAASGTPITISVAKGADVATGAAIIPAQTISGELIEVVTDGGTARFTVASQTFEANHCYTATIAVGLGDIGLTNTIVNWNDENFNAVNSYAPKSLGELTNLINAGGVYSDYLGWYVNADGTISSTNTSAVGIIAYMSTTDVDEDVPGSRILVLSSTDDATSSAWGLTTEMSGAGNISSVSDGYKNTIILKNKYSGKAADVCWSKGSFSGGSNWFLPSMMQWLNIMGPNGIGRNTNDRTKTGMASAIYWTSTDYQTDVAYILTTAGGGSASSKGSGYHVRACFAYPLNALSLSVVNTDQIGWVVTSDGLVYPSWHSAAQAGKTAVAMIAYVGTAGSADTSNGTYRGLAMAISDANILDNSNPYWFGLPSDDITALTNCSLLSDAYNNMSGINNTTALTTQYSSGYAANSVVNYSVSTPTGTSGWFLPSAGQWIRMLNSFGANISSSSTWGFYPSQGNLTAYNNFKNALLNAGDNYLLYDATGIYNFCTSSEYNTANVVRIIFYPVDGVSVSYGRKDRIRKNRPVFAF